METIYKYLQDPSWWFTAFFIAVIASIIAGFAKDYLARRFDIFFSWSHKYREKMKADRKILIDTWSANENLLIIALLQMFSSILFFITLMLTMLIYLTYLKLQYRLTNLSGFTTLPTMTIWCLGFSIVVVSYYAFKIGKIVLRSTDTLTAFYRKRSLQPFL